MHSHLHVGHHRQPQGGDDHPRQHHVRGEALLQRIRPRPRRRGDQLPSAVAHCGAGVCHPQPARQRHLHVVRGKSGTVGRQPARSAAHALRRRAAGLGEDPGEDGRRRRGEPAAAPQDRRLGAASGPGSGLRRPAGTPPAVPVPARRQARVQQGPRAPRPRPLPRGVHVCRADLKIDARVLPEPRHPDLRGLRDERMHGSCDDLAAGSLPHRQGRLLRPRNRDSRSPRTARSASAAATSSRAISKAPKRLPK